jgi:hypothetical protein
VDAAPARAASAAASQPRRRRRPLKRERSSWMLHELLLLQLATASATALALAVPAAFAAAAAASRLASRKDLRRGSERKAHASSTRRMATSKAKPTAKGRLGRERLIKSEIRRYLDSMKPRSRKYSSEEGGSQQRRGQIDEAESRRAGEAPAAGEDRSMRRSHGERERRRRRGEGLRLRNLP